MYLEYNTKLCFSKKTNKQKTKTKTKIKQQQQQT